MLKHFKEYAGNIIAIVNTSKKKKKRKKIPVMKVKSNDFCLFRNSKLIGREIDGINLFN